jgi:hypothetical protein
MSVAARVDKADELRRLKEDLRLATKRAAEVLREDPIRARDSASTTRAQLADEKVNAIKRRIADIEQQSGHAQGR